MLASLGWSEALSVGRRWHRWFCGPAGEVAVVAPEVGLVGVEGLCFVEEGAGSVQSLSCSAWLARRMRSAAVGLSLVTVGAGESIRRRRRG